MSCTSAMVSRISIPSPIPKLDRFGLLGPIDDLQQPDDGQTSI